MRGISVKSDEGTIIGLSRPIPYSLINARRNLNDGPISINLFKANLAAMEGIDPTRGNNDTFA
jgi:hypothetical protein